MMLQMSSKHTRLLTVLGSFVAIIVAAGLVLRYAASVQENNNAPNDEMISDETEIETPVAATGTTPDVFQRSIKQGTQLHATPSVDIGLISVRGEVAAVAVRDPDFTPTVRTLEIKAGDTFEITGYVVWVLNVKEIPSFSFAPGSGKDYVTLKFQKK